MRRVVIVLCAALSSCAAMQQGLKDASEGIKPNLEVIPQGEGWSCYASNEQSWAGCWRDGQACNDELAKNQREAPSTVKFGACTPAALAFCMTYEVPETQGDGSMKYVPTAECFPSDLSCVEFVNSQNNKMADKPFRVSQCAQFK